MGEKIKIENFVFYRTGRIVKGDRLRYSEELVRASLSAWVRNTDHSMRRLKRGEKVCTPYADFVAVKI